jgi:uncharacterized membrane protein
VVRPKSIIWFERLYLGSWFVSVVALAVNWSTMRDKISLEPSARRIGVETMMNMVVAGIAISALITLLLWYFTARQHSVVAKWFVVAFFALGLLGIPGLIRSFADGTPVTGVLQILVYALHAAAIVMLFQRDARQWFGEIKDAKSARDIFS